jgi:hypothetical protein
VRETVRRPVHPVATVLVAVPPQDRPLVRPVEIGWAITLHREAVTEIGAVDMAAGAEATRAPAL